jgi:hypothetical protein
VLGGLAGDLLAEARLEKSPQMAGDVRPCFDAGPHFPVRLANQRFHPLDPLVDDLLDSLAPLRLPHFPLAEGLGQRHSALA